MTSTDYCKSDDVICNFAAKRYNSNHRFFYVLRRTIVRDDDLLLYRSNTVSSCSTRTSALSETSSIVKVPFFDAILRQIPWRNYRSQRGEEETDTSQTVAQTRSDENCQSRYELACFKTKEEWESDAVPKHILDLRELLFISDFKQRAENGVTQFCVSLSAERFGLSFCLDSQAEWNNFLTKLHQAHGQVAKPIVHRIEYACNVIIRNKGLAKVPTDPKLQPVQAGPYRLLLLDSNLVFIRDSVEQPALTLYYQWIRQMTRQQRHPLLRRNENLFGLELGHMSDTGEGFVYFRVLDEPATTDAAATTSNSNADNSFPKSWLSDMLQKYMKDNSLVRQRRRTMRSNRSRQSSAISQSFRGSSSMFSSCAPTEVSSRTQLSTAQTLDNLVSDFDQISLSTCRSKDGTIEQQNSGPSTDETSTLTVTKLPLLSGGDTGSSSATGSSHYLMMEMGEETSAPTGAAPISPQVAWTGDTTQPSPSLANYVNNEAWVSSRDNSMMGMFMAGINPSGDRTQRANSVGSKPAPKQTSQYAMPRCCSDILGDSNNAKAMRWEKNNVHRPELHQDSRDTTTEAPQNRDLYVDYLPAANLERTASAGACSGIRPTTSKAQEPCSKHLFGVNTAPMVAALSLVNTASTHSQVNSCSTSSSAVQFPNPNIDDYGLIHLPSDDDFRFVS